MMQRPQHFGRLFLIIIFLFKGLLSLGQPREILSVPASYPKPEWYHSFDWRNPNLFHFDSVINSWISTLKRENEHFQGEDNPYLNAYKRWRIRVEPLIQSNGYIQDIDFGQPFPGNTEFVQQANNVKSNANSFGNWKLLGPLNTFSSGKSVPWQTNVFTFAIDKNNPNLVYCGTESGHLFKSTDKGKVWNPVLDKIPFPNHPITSLSLSKINAGTIYIYAKSLLKSTDEGSTWSTLTGYKGGYTEDVEVNSFTDRIYVANDTGILISDDGGSAWKYADGSKKGRIYDIVVSSDDGKIVFASGATSNGNLFLLKSTDGGNTFIDKTGALSALFNTGSRMAVTAANSSILYCLVLGKDAPRLFKSIDKGENWIMTVASTATGLAGSNVSVGLGMSNGQGFYDMDLCVSDKNPNEVIVATTTAYKSTDGGLNFSPLGGYIGPFPIHPDIQTIKTFGNDTYICTDGGINYSTDFFTSFANYDVRIQGIASVEFWGFGQGWDEDVVVGGRYHNGNTALSELYGSGNSLRLGGGEDATGHVFHGLSGIVGFRDIGTLKLPSSILANAVQAEIRNTKWPTDDFYGQFSSRLMIDPRYKNVYYVGNGKNLLRSGDYGSTYDTLAVFASNVWRFDISRTNASVFYLATTDGFFKSTDGGKSWSKLILPPGVNYAFYNSDIVVSPSDENKVFISMASNSNSSHKVFMSKDGGISWINLTGSVLNGKKVAYLQSDGTMQDGLYAITNFPGRVYYRNSTMSDWVDFNNGLPDNLSARQGGIIFFRDNKIRICGNRGVWESPLYFNPEPQAQPMANTGKVDCSKDTVYFNDYSILNYTDAKWKWSFPGATYVSDSLSRNPKVVFGTPGSYDVTLTVEDVLGRKSTKTVKNIVSFENENCIPDSLAGLAFRSSLDSSVLNIGKAMIRSNSFTITCWAKPSGLQRSFAQLVGHDPYPGSNYGFGLGFSFKGYTPNLNLCYTDQTVGYGNSSSLIADTASWNFIALVYEPSGVKIYLNGKSEIVNNRQMPVIDLSQTPFYINKDIHNQGGYFKGLIDEIKIYNYSLTETELREKMHLIQDNAMAERGLLKYIQFNKFSSNSVYDLIAGTRINVSSKFIVKSTAPVGSGKVFRIPMISGPGIYSFPGTGLRLQFKYASTYPNGELVAFRLNVKPDFIPFSTSQKFPGHYWVINNYGSVKSFSGIDTIGFSDLLIRNPTHIKSDFSLYKRSPTGIDSSWVSIQNGASTFSYNGVTSNYIAFRSNNLINESAQLLILDNAFVDTSLKVISKSKPCIGDTVTLIAADNLQYRWLKDGQILLNQNTQVYKVVTSGAYRVIVTNSNGFTDTSGLIQVNLPSLPVTPSADTINLCKSDTGIELKVEPLSNHTINWFLDSNLITPKLSSAPVFKPSVPGTISSYFISQQNLLTGCESRRIKITAKVNPLPSIPLVSDTLACKNASPITLSASASSGNTIVWYGSDSLTVNYSLTAPQINTSQAGTIRQYLAQRNNFGCVSDKVKINITIVDLPLSPGAQNFKFCQGSSAQALNISALSGHTAKWYNSLVSVSPLASDPIPPSQIIGNITYYVSQRSNTSGCESQRTPITVTIHPLPPLPAISDLNICQNASVSPLSAVASSGHTLNWYGNSMTGGISSPNAPLPSSLQSGSFDYYVSQTNTATGCESGRAKLAVVVNPIPAKPIISRDGNSNLVSSYPTGNQWYRDGSIISGAIAQSYKPVDAALYTVISRQNGCSSLASESYYYLITALTYVGEGELIQLYPNPVSSKLIVKLKLNYGSPINILMYDKSGKSLGSWQQKKSFEIDMSAYPMGVLKFVFKKHDGTIIYTTNVLKTR